MGGAASTENQEQIESGDRESVRRELSTKDFSRYDETRKLFFVEDLDEMEWNSRICKKFPTEDTITVKQLSELLKTEYSILLDEKTLQEEFGLPTNVSKEKFKVFCSDLRKTSILSEMYAMAAGSKEDWNRFVKQGMVVSFSQHVYPDFGDGANRDEFDTIPDIPKKGSQFIKFLFSDVNDAVCPSKRKDHDLGLPISQYYIRSTGNDFPLCTTAEEVFNLFTERLKRGTRSIYFDCWNPTADNPEGILVFQGCVFGLSDDEKKKLTLEAALHIVLKESCSREVTRSDGTKFAPPMFISVTFLCAPEHNSKVSSKFVEVFGNRIEKLNLPDDTGAPLPALNDLQGKVILFISPYDISKTEEVDPQLMELFSFQAADTNEFFDMIEEGNVAMAPSQVGHLTALDVCAYTNVLDKLSWSRLTQVRFERQLEDDSVTTINTAAPGFNPLRAWRYGVQFVPLDCAAVTEQSWTQQMVFSQNNGCGFVQKSNKKPKPGQPIYSLNVTVILAKRVPRLSVETCPYIKLSFDSGTGSQQVSISTSQPDDNGLYCVWNETFSFKLTSLSSVQTLLFAIRDRDSPANDDLAWCAIPVPHLRPGTRRMRLSDPQGKPIKGGKLLAHFQFTIDDE